MRAFVVRPVMIGLLALIIAGLWGTPLGTRGALVAQVACLNSAAPVPQSLLHRGNRC
jgi:hypothetical protein